LKHKNIPYHNDVTIIKTKSTQFYMFGKKIIPYNNTIKNDNINLIYNGIMLYFVETENCIKNRIFYKKMGCNQLFFLFTKEHFVIEKNFN